MSTLHFPSGAAQPDGPRVSAIVVLFRDLVLALGGVDEQEAELLLRMMSRLEEIEASQGAEVAEGLARGVVAAMLPTDMDRVPKRRPCLSLVPSTDPSPA